MLDANYFVEAKVLSWGTTACVHRAQHIASGRPVVVKSTKLNSAASWREAALLRSLRHRCIVTCLGAFEDDTDVHVVLENCSGGDLFDLIKDRGRLDEATAKSAMHSLLSALAYCHERGVSHRDVKPENIGLTHTGEQAGRALELKLLDFGAACAFSDQQNQVVGTIKYIAPEVLVSNYRGGSCDVWGAGVSLFVMLSGGATPTWCMHCSRCCYHCARPLPCFRCSNDSRTLLTISHCPHRHRLA